MDRQRQVESFRPKPTQTLLPRPVFVSLYRNGEGDQANLMAPTRTPNHHMFGSPNSAFAVLDKEQRPKLFVDTSRGTTNSNKTRGGGKQCPKQWPMAPRAVHTKIFWNNATVADSTGGSSDVDTEVCSRVLRELDINTVPVPRTMPFYTNSAGRI